MTGKPESSKTLGDLYDEGYFHGITSGYSSEGYRHCHPDWAAWLGLIQALQPGGRLIDLGCAYGLLIGAAEARGYRAFGCDVSPFALHQEPRLSSRLVQGNLEQIPFASGQGDVVVVLDVLEHLIDPVAGLAEAVRILSPHGLLVGATPDPLFFDRIEETHFSERPPAFWIHHLRRLGCVVVPRFSVVPYNFQFLACRPGTEMEERIRHFQHDYFSESPDFLRAEGLTAVPRWGWGPLTHSRRELRDSGASVYLLNPDGRPRATSGQLTVTTSGGFSTLRIRLDSWVLAETHLDSEATERTLDLGDFLVPAGGHHLFFDLFPGGTTVEIGDLVIDARPAAREDLTAGLPFDVFQRYEGAARVVRILRPRSLLDVGGCIGDAEGHLATSADFFDTTPGHSPEILSTDLRQCDLPNHLPCPALEHPLADGSFEMVVSLDVLEHIPPSDRRRFLGELDRLATECILVGAPFRSETVERAEALLSEHVLKDHTFLAEHRDLGLPGESLLIDYAREKGYALWELANGFLPSWLEMQAFNALFFSFHDYGLSRAFNSLYNRHGFEGDLRSPSYRKMFVLIKGRERRNPELAEQLEALTRQPDLPPRTALGPGSEAELQALVCSAQRLLARRDKALSDAQFLANARDEHIALLMQERETLIRQLRETPLHVLARQRWKEKRTRGKGERHRG